MRRGIRRCCWWTGCRRWGPWSFGWMSGEWTLRSRGRRRRCRCPRGLALCAPAPKRWKRPSTRPPRAATSTGASIWRATRPGLTGLTPPPSRCSTDCVPPSTSSSKSKASTTSSPATSASLKQPGNQKSPYNFFQNCRNFHAKFSELQKFPYKIFRMRCWTWA
jgi:hypothetical protein